MLDEKLLREFNLTNYESKLDCSKGLGWIKEDGTVTPLPRTFNKSDEYLEGYLDGWARQFYINNKRR